MFNKALYYPWIEVQDMAWLKTSALYWDEISTIVPESLGQPFLDYNSRLLFDEGILKSEIVNSRTISSAYLRNDVINYFEKYERYYSKLLSQKNRRNEYIITFAIGIYFLISGIRTISNRAKIKLSKGLFSNHFTINNSADFIELLDLIKIFIGSMLIIIVLSVLTGRAKLE